MKDLNQILDWAQINPFGVDMAHRGCVQLGPYSPVPCFAEAIHVNFLSNQEMKEHMNQTLEEKGNRNSDLIPCYCIAALHQGKSWEWCPGAWYHHRERPQGSPISSLYHQRQLLKDLLCLSLQIIHICGTVLVPILSLKLRADRNSRKCLSRNLGSPVSSLKFLLLPVGCRTNWTEKGPVYAMQLLRHISCSTDTTPVCEAMTFSTLWKLKRVSIPWESKNSFLAALQTQLYAAWELFSRARYVDMEKQVSWSSMGMRWPGGSHSLSSGSCSKGLGACGSSYKYFMSVSARQNNQIR